MRRSLATLSAALLLMAPLAAEALPFEATLSYTVGNLTVSVGGSGVAPTSSAGSNLLGVTIPAGAAFGTATVPQTNPANLPGLAGLSMIAANGTGAFARTPAGPLVGTLPIGGIARICVFSDCSSGPAASMWIPISVAGNPGATLTAETVAVALTVTGAAWTTGMVALPGSLPSTGPVNATGFLHGPASATSSAAQVGGAFSLVTPIAISTSLGQHIRSYARFTVTFVPEPASAALLGGGLALLAGAGARRRR